MKFRKMHRPSSFRRRSSYAPQLCVAGAIVLLLLSLLILHTRISSSPLSLSFPFRSSTTNRSAIFNLYPPFEEAAIDSFDDGTGDPIDDLDVLDVDKKLSTTSDDAIVGPGSGLFWDHALGVARISFTRTESRSAFADNYPLDEDRVRSKLAFGSDDEPVDESVKAKMASVQRIEDALLLKVEGHEESAGMRDGWARWLEGKADFLRRDRMLRSNLETLLPKNHPLLQDPDVPGFSGLTRNDRIMQKAILKQMEKGDSIGMEMKRMVGRKMLYSNVERVENEDRDDWRRGHFPGIDSKLGFSEFVEKFLCNGECSFRIFMVRNSSSCSLGIRPLRGLEILLHHHRNACVLLFSETIGVEFFKDFAKDGPFVKECLTEFFSSYDGTLSTLSKSQLLTRVIKRLQSKGNKVWERFRVKIIPPQSIFPVISKNIKRYFSVASKEAERANHQDIFIRILIEPYTFYYWNGRTSELVAEHGSVAEKI